MKNLIIGYGYSGYHIARQLLADKQEVIAWSRSNNRPVDGLMHQRIDIDEGDIKFPQGIQRVFYLLPPESSGQQDRRMQKLLKEFPKTISEIIYISSSGVYGNHDGAWVDEQSELFLKSDRQYRRYDAEQQLLKFAQDNSTKLAILRSAGIYGEGRIPLEKARNQSPLIKLNQAPIINYIFVEDLATAAVKIIERVDEQEIFNLSDGQPKSLGSSQRIVAESLQIEPAPEVSFDNYWQGASPMMREFLASSKRLSNEKIVKRLAGIMQFSPLSETIKTILAIT